MLHSTHYMFTRGKGVKRGPATLSYLAVRMYIPRLSCKQIQISCLNYFTLTTYILLLNIRSFFTPISFI